MGHSAAVAALFVARQDIERENIVRHPGLNAVSVGIRLHGGAADSGKQKRRLRDVGVGYATLISPIKRSDRLFSERFE